jgi:fatty acid desaturase
MIRRVLASCQIEIGKIIPVRRVPAGIEWPTLGLLALTYGLWLLGTAWLYSLSPVLGVVLTGLAITQFSSLQHEALHGHPFRNPVLNEALVFPGLTLTVPYERFRDVHLAHHHDPILTDPYDDPESNFFDPAVWVRLPRALRFLFSVNNALLGRIVLGPLIGTVIWLTGEANLIRRGDRAVIRAWVLHGFGLVPVVAWLWLSAMPWWAYLLSAWHGVLKIRTFLEHRAHVVARARTVVIEDRGILSLLFLNNNFHAVHHMHPGVAWYDLPGLYAARRAHYLRHNDGYFFRSYGEIVKSYLLRVKDPVSHPLWPQPDEAQREAPPPSVVAAE